MSENESEEYRCERCQGTGWLHSRSGHYGQDKLWVATDAFPDCTECNGSGVLTKNQLEAHWDRFQ